MKGIIYLLVDFLELELSMLTYLEQTTLGSFSH